MVFLWSFNISHCIFLGMLVLIQCCCAPPQKSRPYSLYEMRIAFFIRKNGHKNCVPKIIKVKSFIKFRWMSKIFVSLKKLIKRCDAKPERPHQRAACGPKATATARSFERPCAKHRGQRRSCVVQRAAQKSASGRLCRRTRRTRKGARRQP